MARIQKSRKTSADKTARPKKAGRTSRVTIDYPQEGEVLTGPTYAFRISGVPAKAQAEVSVNGTEWRPCREAVGLWWFDFSGYSDGEYELRARVRSEGSDPGPDCLRWFRVRAEQPAPLETASV